MALHLVKLAVGIDDLAQLRRVRAERAAERGGNWIHTRNRPRRADEVLDGGSIYWVIRGHIRVRQRVTGFRIMREEGGRRYCVIAVDPQLVPTVPRPYRPFQGWRYLVPADAPPDLQGREPPPDQMLAELRALGLL
jgi:hypothetical protein